MLLRSDGVPLYNFGAVVDDCAMGITLVARGRDHMVNTPPQILLYEAFGHPPPVFAHLPMMLAPNGEKLSKRHGAVSVTEYREQGYSPEAVLNYLARFGWSHGDQEVFSRDELVAAFDWEHCNKADGKFDAKKFLAINHEHLKSPRLTGEDAYVDRLMPFLAARGLPDLDRARGARVYMIRDRATARFVDAADRLDFVLSVTRRCVDEAAAASSSGCPPPASAHPCCVTSPRRSRAWSRGRRRRSRRGPTRGSPSAACRSRTSPRRRAWRSRAERQAGLYDVIAALGKARAIGRLISPPYPPSPPTSP